MIERLEFRSDLASVERAEHWIEEIAPRLDLSPDQVFRLQLCVEEALTNLVRHAFPAGRSYMIWMSVGTDDGLVLLTIDDDGMFFDPTRVKTPEIPESLAAAPIGGLGIHLMRQFSRTMTYGRAGERNRLALTFVRDGEGQGDEAASAG